ncbi:hypothetical protein [Pedococcus sp. 5OH_020]|uniref:hypothetical protein n=1 Tax=Pedococcus sp. 5OH_020 TaxID=2989814 RepID=UPI0022E9DA3B|nr:hypothetical protein [Pedococcus sp. 5OH_020]
MRGGGGAAGVPAFDGLGEHGDSRCAGALAELVHQGHQLAQRGAVTLPQLSAESFESRAGRVQRLAALA